MNSEQIRKFFADYQVILKRVEQLEAAMRIKSDWDTWCAALRERADFFRTEYAHECHDARRDGRVHEGRTCFRR